MSSTGVEVARPGHMWRAGEGPQCRERAHLRHHRRRRGPRKHGGVRGVLPQQLEAPHQEPHRRPDEQCHAVRQRGVAPEAQPPARTCAAAAAGGTGFRSFQKWIKNGQEWHERPVQNDQSGQKKNSQSWSKIFKTWVRNGQGVPATTQNGQKGQKGTKLSRRSQKGAKKRSKTLNVNKMAENRHASPCTALHCRRCLPGRGRGRSRVKTTCWKQISTYRKKTAQRIKTSDGESDDDA